MKSFNLRTMVNLEYSDLQINWPSVSFAFYTFITFQSSCYSESVTFTIYHDPIITSMRDTQPGIRWNENTTESTSDPDMEEQKL